MTNIDKLLSLGTKPLGPNLRDMPNFFFPYALGTDLLELLRLKNGFYAFDSALHVFPITVDSTSGMEAWNSDALWRKGYGDLADGLLFFAEDILQDQFCLSENTEGVLRFYAETGETAMIADSVEEWASAILSDYRNETGSPFALAWQSKHGPLAEGDRLMPRIPFFLGGEYDLDNLWAGNALDGMRLKADLAVQTRNLPDGSQVQLNVAPQPNR